MILDALVETRPDNDGAKRPGLDTEGGRGDRMRGEAGTAQVAEARRCPMADRWRSVRKV